MIPALLLLVAWGTLGSGIARVTAAKDTDPFEIAVRGAIAAFATWVSSAWLLAFGQVLYSATVIVSAVAALVVGVMLHRRANAGVESKITVPPLVLAVVLPTALWVIYAVSRATLLPVGNHDALSYHFPRAVNFVLDHGYRFHAEIPDNRVATFPANYELLIATVFAAFGSDRGVVFIDLASYLSFGLVGAWFTRRWWPGMLPALVVFGLTCTTPLAVLHSAAYKNDLLLSFCAAAAVQWLVRFAFDLKRVDVVWGIIAIGLAVGTKSHGVLFAVALTPFVLAGVLRARSRAIAVSVAQTALGAILALGGVVIAINLVKTHSTGLGVYDFHNAGGPFFSDWQNFWRYPITILAAPFTSTDSIWVFWSDERYWWSEASIFCGHFGAAFTLALLAIPFVERWLKPQERRLERGLMLLVPIAMACVILPTRVRPYGFFLQQARYGLAVVPIALAWGAGGVTSLIARVPAHRMVLARTAMAVLVGVWFARSAWRMGEADDYQPFRFVAEAALREEPVREPFANVFHKRVGYLVDRVAGPNDVVAVDDGFDTWLYPMYGIDHRRPVKFISVGPDGKAVIPPDATWVAIDRGQQEFFFMNPGLVDFRLSLMGRYFGRGKPADENFVVLRQMEANPEFDLAYIDRKGNQALFHRRSRSATP